MFQFTVSVLEGGLWKLDDTQEFHTRRPGLVQSSRDLGVVTLLQVFGLCPTLKILAVCAATRES